ncbi:MAG: hypothetical protein KC613_23485 [Myxococcales bacterium]|nr:hypothetical protein [Myxococcales bacterium]MCB9522890.1 hypothetical protein [Myxococcales bacterium]
MPDPFDLLDRLDRWRHLPDYQLERRADVFFSLYLPEVLGAHFGAAFDPTLVPEFPVRLGLIHGTPSNQSFKVDYLALSADRSALWLVELKTDPGSRNTTQDENMQGAVAAGAAALLQGVVHIARASKHKQKYGHLLAALAGLGLLRVPGDLWDILYPDVRRGLTARLGDIRVAPGVAQMTVRLAYVQPEAHHPGEIGFDTVAAVVERHLDPLSQRFAASLRRWSRVAGSTDPRSLG